MSHQKHYSAEYLQDTAKAMQELKTRSYSAFLHLKEGKIVDLGCGIGMDAIMMAKLSSNEKEFVGIDHDPIMIQKAKSSAEGMNNINFIQQEILPLPFENEEISGVRAERLFQHLKDSDAVYTDIYRVLKKDAPFVILETDWNSLAFYVGDVKIERKIQNYLTGQKVNNGFAAKRLLNDFKKYHFNNIEVGIFPLVTYSYQEANLYLMVDRIIEEMLENNLIDKIEYDHFTSSLKIADQDNYFCCSINMVLVKGTK